MTTNLLRLTDTVTIDTDDTLLQQEILKKIDEIRTALAQGQDYVLNTPRGQVVIHADPVKKSA
jgi:hypothetical protein